MKLTNTPTQRINAPEGTYPAVCVDFVELGVKETSFGSKEKVEFVFQTPHRNPETTKPLTVGARFNVSFHEKASLRQFMERWRGKKYTEAQVKEGVDPEASLHRPALLTVEHNEGSDGNTYANITSCVPLPEGLTAPEPWPEYERVMEREEGWDVRSPHSKAMKPAPVINRPKATADLDPDELTREANAAARRQPVAAGDFDYGPDDGSGLPF